MRETINRRGGGGTLISGSKIVFICLNVKSFEVNKIIVDTIIDRINNI